jgi:hypothetical protein
MTVFVYINTAKEIGDVDHLKVFANREAAERWFEENDPEGVALNMRFWSKDAGRSQLSTPQTILFRLTMSA